MKKIRLLTLLFLIPLMANAQGINGSWTGLLEAGPAKLNIVFNINADGTVTMDSPDQGAMGLPAEVKYLKDDSLALEMPNIRADYAGTLVREEIRGTF